MPAVGRPWPSGDDDDDDDSVACFWSQPGGGGGKTNNQPMIILPVNWAESICISTIYHNTVYILHHYRHIIYDMLMMAISRGGKSLKLLVSVYNVWVSWVSCFSWLPWFQLSVGEETGA